MWTSWALNVYLCSIDLWNYGFSTEGPETWLKVNTYDPSRGFPGLGFLVLFNGGSVEVGNSAVRCTYRNEDLNVQVKVTVGSLPDPSIVFLQWSASRDDTGATVVSRVSRYSDPGGDHALDSASDGRAASGEWVHHQSRPFFSPGKLLTYNMKVTVRDWLDRNRPFVTWVSHTFFPDPGKPHEWRYSWKRDRHSRIHRTDYPGRCRRLSPPDEILAGWLE